MSAYESDELYLECLSCGKMLSGYQAIADHVTQNKCEFETENSLHDETNKQEKMLEMLQQGEAKQLSFHYAKVVQVKTTAQKLQPIQDQSNFESPKNEARSEFQQADTPVSSRKYVCTSKRPSSQWIEHIGPDSKIAKFHFNGYFDFVTEI